MAVTNPTVSEDEVKPKKKPAAKKKATPKQKQDSAAPLTEQEEAVVESAFKTWTKQEASGKPFKVLLYGAAGAGKTTMASTFPKPLFLDLEDGMRSINTDNLPAPVLRYPKDPALAVRSMGEVRHFFTEIRKLEGKAPFETIVIDSINELQNLIMKNILTKFDQKRQMDDQPTLQDYGKLARDSLSVVRLFLQLPYNVIFTCAAIPQEYLDQQVYPVFLGKKTGPEVLRLVEMVGFCHTRERQDEIEHVVSFETTPNWVAKDRYGVSELVIPNNFNALKGA